nr:unnamed protein product [Callosobruchus analis]
MITSFWNTFELAEQLLIK